MSEDDEDFDDEDVDLDEDEVKPKKGRVYEGAPTAPEILSQSLVFLDEFRAQDVSAVTVRQMYYRFLAKGFLVKPTRLVGDDAKKWWNRQYKRIGKVLSTARYRNRFPMDGIRDGGRHVRPGDFTRDVKRHEIGPYIEEGVAMQQAVPNFLVQRARWHGQPVHLSVWVEKEGMESIFQDVCLPAGVSVLACKGYPSVSALYEWLKLAYFAVHGEHPYDEHRLYQRRSYSYGNGFDWTEHHRGTADECVVLYYGDHDPDGWQIPRSAQDGLYTLMHTYGMHVPLKFVRVALLMDQIEEHDAPPFEAKVSSSRYRSYVKEHGTNLAWELDALDPVVLRDLIRKGVHEHFDRSIYDRNRVEISSFRASLREAMNVPDTGTDLDPEDPGPDEGAG